MGDLQAGEGLYEAASVGVEYRVSTVPLAGTSCTDALIDDEPWGPPGDFMLQQVALNLRFQY
jgi:hypothetical protein